jgi:hypothetical protein
MTAMERRRPTGRTQVDILRAKQASGAAEKAAADAELADLQRKTTALVRDYFRSPSADCSLRRRLAGHGDIRAAAAKADCFWCFGPEERPMLVGFDDQLVIAAADIAVASALVSVADAAPTTIDRALAAALARRLALVFSPSSDDILHHPQQSGSVDSGLIEASPRWNLISVTIEAGASRPLTAYAAIPTEPCSSRAAEKSVAALRARFGALKVDARCIAGGFAAPLARVLSIAPGEIIPIDWREKGAAPLMIADKEVATGSLGQHDDKRAFKIGGQ